VCDAYLGMDERKCFHPIQNGGKYVEVVGIIKSQPVCKISYKTKRRRSSIPEGLLFLP
jgi:hypothetical protein